MVFFFRIWLLHRVFSGIGGALGKVRRQEGETMGSTRENDAKSPQLGQRCHLTTKLERNDTTTFGAGS
jgi:hypothetical protein